jgi:two-component system, response regulator PdtaR
MHALVIEDNSLIAALIGEELRDLGYASIDFAETEIEAVAASRRCAPDLITSDGALHAGSGISAIRTIWSECAVPVVFITGDSRDIHHFLPTAIVLEKPFSVRQLALAVADATHRAVSW